MGERCREMEFSLYGRGGDALVEGVSKFKYLGRTLDQTDNAWPATKQNIKRVRTVWGRLGKLLIWEGADPRVVVISLQGGGTGGTNFWIGDLAAFCRDGEECGGHTRGFSQVDQG